MSQRLYLVHRERIAPDDTGTSGDLDARRKEEVEVEVELGTELAERFSILGSTGNSYTVVWDIVPQCDW